MAKHKDRIISLSEEGKSYSEIQKILGCSKGTISYHLGAGQKEKMLKRQQKKRNIISSLIATYKQERGCADCKENYPYWILEFDHLRDKKFAISQYRLYTLDIDLVKKEIEKCEVVCSNCHKNRTHLRSLMNGKGVLEISNFY
jgi:transposase